MAARSRLVALVVLSALGCGARTGLDVPQGEGSGANGGASSSSGAGSGGSATGAAYCSIEDGPVSTVVPGHFTGTCPASLPYCVIVPGMALYGCCPTAEGAAEGCYAPGGVR